ncbi:MAG: GTP-binding protein, partial [Zetaproteobacteria bacterium]
MMETGETEKLRSLDTHEAIREEIKNLIEKIRCLYEERVLEWGDGDIDARLKNAAKNVEDPALLVCFVGKYNAGKSSLINALVGARVLDVDINPTTDKIIEVEHADSAPKDGEKTRLDEHIARLRVNSDWLKHHSQMLKIKLVDTPGIDGGHQDEATAEAYYPRTDIIVFTTSIEQAMNIKEEEHLKHIADYKKDLILVVNKLDMIHSFDEIRKVKERVRHEMSRMFSGVTPPIFFTSSVRTDIPGNELEKFREYLESTLRDRGILNKKLRTPMNALDDIVKFIRAKKDEEEQDIDRKERAWKQVNAYMMGHFRNELNRKYNGLLSDKKESLDNLIKQIYYLKDKESNDDVKVDYLFDDFNRTYGQRVKEFNGWLEKSIDEVCKEALKIVNRLGMQVDDIPHFPSQLEHVPLRVGDKGRDYEDAIRSRNRKKLFGWSIGWFVGDRKIEKKRKALVDYIEKEVEEQNKEEEKALERLQKNLRDHIMNHLGLSDMEYFKEEAEKSIEKMDEIL